MPNHSNGLANQTGSAYSLTAYEQARAKIASQGWTALPGLLNRETCCAIRQLYEKPELFRSRVFMSRHGFGQGEYQYLAYPLPPDIQALREGLYAQFAPIANLWRSKDSDCAFPEELSAFTARCHQLGQTRPTPLILKYSAGDYNRLHQDLYGDLYFPLQVVVLLSEPGREFEGGEFVLTQQKPRSQTRVDVIPLEQGDAIVFAVNERQVITERGRYTVRMRHGVSEVRSGTRFTLGIIFHDAA